MVSAVEAYLPTEVWEFLSPTIYLAFWSLSMYDIQVPTAKYDVELKRLRDRSKILMVPLPPIIPGRAGGYGAPPQPTEAEQVRVRVRVKKETAIEM
jgi:hypothetical protein